MSSTYKPIKVSKFTPLHDGVIVSDMAFNERYSSGGIFIPNDDKQIHGIHPRWGKVYAVGPEQKDITVGQWVCISHGRWTRGINIEDDNGLHTIRRIDNADILLVTDEQPVDESLGRPL